MQVPCPSIEQQNKFIEYVENIEKAKTLINSDLMDLETLLKIKLNEYFN